MAWIRLVSELVQHQFAGWKAWALAAALFGLGFLLRQALDPWLASVTFLPFHGVVIAVTALCGLWPGVAVAVLSALAGWYWFLPLRAGSGLASFIAPAGFLAVALFQVTLVAALAEVVRRFDAMRIVRDDLFRELQHRVANNMQLIAATLAAARRDVDSPPAQDAINQALARVHAMASLHRNLHDPEAYRDGLEPVLREVLAEAFHDLPVEVAIAVASHGLSISDMTAIVLLVNEAALNAAKHVFRPGLGRRFEVMLQDEAGALRLVIRDDGPGLAAPEVAPARPGRLGMSIMQSLAKQLGGNLETLAGASATLQVTFEAR